ncbi:glycosyltransferase [Zunongwangia sp. F363]|uniref:Glycosyltransferase n=1 Tax=Autumnicola tepida TaxID=3075595 RepID=A0ABU3CA11_9FLAO|nr:glycosyltransferase [Zunongwangia sp. F363]MDT0643047.1 glycosyltransferase [Zunongwangia sp. F363]
MKSILFKIQQFPHLSETFVLNHIIMAIKLGYEVKILVKDVLDFEKSMHVDKLKRYHIAEKIIHENYHIPNNKFFRLIKAVKISFSISNWSKIISFFKLKSKFSLTWLYEIAFYNQFRKTDIIHVQYGTNVHPVDILKKAGLLKSKLIVSFHGHDAFFPINGFIENNGYYQHLFTGDNLVVANTPYLAEKIKGLGCSKENLTTIPVPVDIEYFHPDKNLVNGKEIKIITVGRLDPVKGHYVAIEFINRIRKKGLSITFTIVGEGSEYEKLKRKIAELTLEKTINLVGRKSQGEVRDLLNQSDIYLFTGIPVAEGRRETQGLATLEAQACGLPVLAFDSGGVKYTMKNGITGFLCAENDLNCLSEKLQLLCNKNLRKKMGGEARKFVQEVYSQNEVKKKWKAIYK